MSTNVFFNLFKYIIVLIAFFYYLQRSRIQVWLYEQVNMRIEGCIIVGFVFIPTVLCNILKWGRITVKNVMKTDENQLRSALHGFTSYL